MPRTAPAPFSLPRAASLIATAGLAALLALGAASALAEDYKLPDSQEISTLPAEALRFYTAGIAALDRSDDLNAYYNLAKASMLAPNAIRLNTLAAGLAIKQGKATRAAEAINHYETGIACLRNVLAHRELEEDFRREIDNRLRVASDERDNLEQRDATRDARGYSFIVQLNRDLSENNKSNDKDAPHSRGSKDNNKSNANSGKPAPNAPPLPGPAAVPGYAPAPVQPGTGTTPYPTTLPTPAPSMGK